MNKKEAFENNYVAIKEMLDGNMRSPRSWDKEKLKLYQGYGGLKEILLDPEKPGQWSPSIEKFKTDVQKLNELLRSGLKDESRIEAMKSSLHNSVLTSFYTQENLIDSILYPLKDIFPKDKPLEILDPCTGKGSYISVIQQTFKGYDYKITGFEKEKTAGWFASKITGEKIHLRPFEEVSLVEPGKKYDLIVSNIPFGDIPVYDSAFAKGKDKELAQSQKHIHNYFFAKGASLLNQAGIIAYITSTGVMDSPSNQFIREHLIKNATLISADRLPNTAFSDAGTEVTSDVIILRKRDTPLKDLNGIPEHEKAFLTTSAITIKDNEFQINGYFNLYPEKVHGELNVGTFYGGRKVLTVDEDRNYIESVGQSIKNAVGSSVIQAIASKDAANLEVKPDASNVMVLPGTSSFDDIRKAYDNAEKEGRFIDFLVGDRKIKAHRKYTYLGGNVVNTRYLHLSWVDDLKNPTVEFKHWKENRNGSITETTVPVHPSLFPQSPAIEEFHNDRLEGAVAAAEAASPEAPAQITVDFDTKNIREDYGITKPDGISLEVINEVMASGRDAGTHYGIGPQEYLEVIRANYDRIYLNNIEQETSPFEPVRAASLDSFNLAFKDISERAFVVTGDTYPLKDFLKETLGGKWNSLHRAWMYPSSHKERVEQALLSHLEGGTPIQNIPVPDAPKAVPMGDNYTLESKLPPSFNISGLDAATLDMDKGVLALLAKCKEKGIGTNIEVSYNRDFIPSKTKGESIYELRFKGDFISKTGFAQVTGKGANENLTIKELIEASLAQHFREAFYSRANLEKIAQPTLNGQLDLFAPAAPAFNLEPFPRLDAEKLKDCPPESFKHLQQYINLYRDGEIKDLVNMPEVQHIHSNGFIGDYFEKVTGFKLYPTESGKDREKLADELATFRRGVISRQEEERVKISKGTGTDKQKQTAADYGSKKATTVQNTLKLPSKELSQEFIDSNNLKEGNLFKLNRSIVLINRDNDNGKWGFEDLRLVGPKADRATGIIDVRMQYQKLLTLEHADVPAFGDIQKQREQLNQTYDAFTREFGPLNETANKVVVSLDSFAPEIKSLEREEHGVFIKSDILHRSLLHHQDTTLDIDNIDDAVGYSINKYGKIDIKEIASLLKRDENEVIIEGINKKLIAPNPVFANEWNSVDASNNPQSFKGAKYELVLFDEFKSGPVFDKINALKENPYRGIDNELTKSLINELETVLPQMLPISEINPVFGERWINEKVYGDFISGLLKGDYKVSYMEGSDSYNIANQSPYPSLNESIYNVKCVNGRTVRTKDIIQHAFNDTTPEINYKIDNVFYLDKEATNNVESNINKVKQAFNEFLKTNKHFHKQMENTYFLTHLQHVKNESGNIPLKFSDLKHFDPREHQRAAAWQLIRNNGGIVDHKVGAGKTLVIAMAAMSMKRMGIAKKPLVIGLKANTSAIYRDIKKAYPEAKVLYPTDKNMSPANRKEFFHRMMNNEYDVVIMTHEQFGKIKASPEVSAKLMRTELKNLEVDMEVLNGDVSPNKTQINGLQKRKQSLEAALKELGDSMSKDELPSFDKLGIDHLFVDESHQFKNLQYTTRHHQVSGLSDTDGSDRSFNLLSAVRHIQDHHKGDKGVTFLSGTMISNSITEMYLLLKYLRPNKLNELKMPTFDAWAKTFAEKSTEYEISSTNEIKLKERFRRFVKLPELSKLYNDIAHVVNDFNLKFPKPDKDEKLIKIPATEAQQEFSANLIRFAQTGNGHLIGRGNLSHNEEKAKMLIATDLAKKMSIDMRLIDPSEYTAEHGSKIHKLCHNLNEYYHRFGEVKGTQFVFSDVGTPTSKNLNLYEDIRRKLVDEYGIPEKEIAFIHEHNSTDNKKAAFQAKVQSGEFRIAIGGTQTMGTGLNMQDRACAMHHLDIPWTPKDYEQRNGRGERQGNWVAEKHCGNKVDTLIYATENSLDAYKFGLLGTKANFINQIKTASISSRSIEESNDECVSFGEFAAAVTGKTELIEKIKKEKELQGYEIKQQTGIKQTEKAQSEIEYHRYRATTSTELLTGVRKDIEAFKKEFPDAHPHNTDGFKITHEGNELAGVTEVGKLIQGKVDAALAKHEYPKDLEVFRMGNFSIRLDTSSDLEGTVKKQMYVHSDITGNRYSNPESTGNVTKTPEPYGKLFPMSLMSMEIKEKRFSKDIDFGNQNIQANETVIKSGFIDYSDKISALKVEISDLEIKINGGDKPKVEVEKGASIGMN
jgi:N12 class adenine-specific DNA methylase